MKTKYDVMPITYLNGVLLGLNAINDAYLWVDSPDCFFYKTHYIFGNHDLNSTINSSDGCHRFNSTISNVDTIIGNNNLNFIDALREFVERDFIKMAFVSSMPMNQIVGVDYDSLINEVKKTVDKPIFNIPSRSMTSCWLDGYEDFLFSLSKNIDIEGFNNSNKKKVGIVGNLFDRNEGDSIGNIEELKNIFEGLGLEVVSIWLDGGSYDDILKIKDAGTIVSLPYGRKAGKKIAKRLEADLLELDLPFGINNTLDFIRSVGKHFEVEEEVVEKFIDSEMKERNDISVIKWIILRFLANKNVLYYGDPYLLNGIIDITDTLGINLRQVFLHSEMKHLKNNRSDKYLKVSGIKTSLPKIDGDINISICNSYLKNEGNCNSAILGFGFPNHQKHFFTKTPFFGIRGALNFINRIYDN